MNDNIEKNENIGNNENIEQNAKVKKNNRKFWRFFLLFVALLTVLTAVAIAFTIKYIDSANQEKAEQNQVVEEQVEEEIKKEAEDKIFALTSYTETYNKNPLEIKEEKVGDISYIQIEGLKDKTVQANINERLKNIAFSFKEGNPVNVSVLANFSNILSVEYTKWDSEIQKANIKTLNIDLTTGGEIPLEKVFISSAPLNSYLAEGLYEVLAWNTEHGLDSEFYEEEHDMDKRDTSEYEDKFLILVRKYNKQKENIKYTISPQGVTVYELIDDEIARDYLKIDFINHMEEVAVYKRYLTEQSIFEKDNKEELIVLTNGPKQMEEDEIISYGKIQENIFTEQVILNWQELDLSKTKQYIKHLSETRLKEIKKELSTKKGMIYQAIYEVYEVYDKDYICVNEYTSKAKCSIEYFDESAFQDYIVMHNAPKADAMPNTFAGQQNRFENFEITNEIKQYYISKDGEFLGNTEEEAEAKLNPTDNSSETDNNNLLETEENNANLNEIEETSNNLNKIEG